MEFFNSAVDVLQTLVVALGAGLGVWGVINLLEGYGNDNPGATHKVDNGARSKPAESRIGGQTGLQFSKRCKRCVRITIERIGFQSSWHHSKGSIVL
jgi:hypothetical protein